MPSNTHPPAPAPTSSEATVLAPSSTSTSNSAQAGTTASELGHHDAQGGESSAPAARAAELARTKLRLLGATKRFPDFPIPGIDFIDILPLFQDPKTHDDLLRALELLVFQTFGAGPGKGPDVIVGLEARGFLFGPSLALRLDASFVPIRKKGKMPGPCVTAAYEKEYGTDHFQIQEAAVRPGQKVLIVDDIIATGGSAQAAGSLVTQLGGTLMGYLFMLEIPFLKGRDKLGHVPTMTLLETDE